MTNNSLPDDDRKIHHVFRWLGLCWTAVLLLRACWSAWQTYWASWGSARASAEESRHKDVIYRRWAFLRGGIYVPATEQTPPNPDLADSQERDIVTPSGRVLTLINPAYMNRQAHEIANKKNGSRGHITSLTPLPWKPYQDALQDARAVVDLDFLQDDIPKLLEESVYGLDRVKRIVQSIENHGPGFVHHLRHHEATRWSNHRHQRARQGQPFLRELAQAQTSGLTV